MDASTDCDLSSNLSPSNLVDAALYFIKAYCLKGAHSLRMVVMERFCRKEIEISAKVILRQMDCSFTPAVTLTNEVNKWQI